MPYLRAIGAAYISAPQALPFMRLRRCLYAESEPQRHLATVHEHDALVT